jgi:O-acetylhomoserine/O-acetylserine sulfhydrylase-like pyridoxal-dependent enzyme
LLQERIATLEGGAVVSYSSGHAARLMALFTIMYRGGARKR